VKIIISGSAVGRKASFVVGFGGPMSRIVRKANIVKDIVIPRYDEYLDSLIAFVDVLGFDNDARSIRSEDDFTRIAKLLFAFKETAQGINQDESLYSHFNMTTMSDSFVVSMPYNDPICAMGLIIFLHKAQYELLATDHRRLLRGYLNRGRVYHNNNVVFGEGYSKAYEFQRYVGHAPRIVIDPSIIQDARNKISAYKGKDKIVHIFDYLKQDEADNLYFIDYLKPVGSQSRLSAQQLAKEREGIKLFIEGSIQQHRDDIRICRKYEWLKNYFSISKTYLSKIGATTS
jgi:hypothetical protein